MARTVRRGGANSSGRKQKTQKTPRIKIKVSKRAILLTWNIVALAALIASVVGLTVKFWPKDVYSREINSFEVKVSEYLDSLNEDDEALVQYVMAEDLIGNSELGNRYFVFSYNPDLKKASTCLEDPSVLEDSNIDMEDYEYNDVCDENMLVMTTLLADILSDVNQGDVKLYIIDLSYSANLTSINDVGDTTQTSLTTGDQCLFFVDEDTDTVTTINSEGSKIAKLKYNQEIKPRLYVYTYRFYVDIDGDGIYEMIEDKYPVFFSDTMYQAPENNSNGDSFRFWCTKQPTSHEDAVNNRWENGETKKYPALSMEETIVLYAYYRNVSL